MEDSTTPESIEELFRSYDQEYLQGANAETTSDTQNDSPSPAKVVQNVEKVLNNNNYRSISLDVSSSSVDKRQNAILRNQNQALGFGKHRNVRKVKEAKSSSSSEEELRDVTIDLNKNIFFNKELLSFPPNSNYDEVPKLLLSAPSRPNQPITARPLVLTSRTPITRNVTTTRRPDPTTSSPNHDKDLDVQDILAEKIWNKNKVNKLSIPVITVATADFEEDYPNNRQPASNFPVARPQQSEAETDDFRESSSNQFMNYQRRSSSFRNRRDSNFNYWLNKVATFFDLYDEPGSDSGREHSNLNKRQVSPQADDVQNTMENNLSDILTSDLEATKVQEAEEDESAPVSDPVIETIQQIIDPETRLEFTKGLPSIIEKLEELEDEKQQASSVEVSVVELNQEHEVKLGEMIKEIQLENRTETDDEGRGFVLEKEIKNVFENAASKEPETADIKIQTSNTSLESTTIRDLPRLDDQDIVIEPTEVFAVPDDDLIQFDNFAQGTSTETPATELFDREVETTTEPALEVINEKVLEILSDDAVKLFPINDDQQRSVLKTETLSFDGVVKSPSINEDQQISHPETETMNSKTTSIEEWLSSNQVISEISETIAHEVIPESDDEMVREDLRFLQEEDLPISTTTETITESDDKQLEDDLPRIAITLSEIVKDKMQLIADSRLEFPTADQLKEVVAFTKDEIRDEIIEHSKTPVEFLDTVSSSFEDLEKIHSLTSKDDDQFNPELTAIVDNTKSLEADQETLEIATSSVLNDDLLATKDNTKSLEADLENLKIVSILNDNSIKIDPLSTIDNTISIEADPETLQSSSSSISIDNSFQIDPSATIEESKSIEDPETLEIAASSVLIDKTRSKEADPETLQSAASSIAIDNTIKIDPSVTIEDIKSIEADPEILEIAAPSSSIGNTIKTNLLDTIDKTRSEAEITIPSSVIDISENDAKTMEDLIPALINENSKTIEDNFNISASSAIIEDPKSAEELIPTINENTKPIADNFNISASSAIIEDPKTAEEVQEACSEAPVIEISDEMSSIKSSTEQVAESIVVSVNQPKFVEDVAQEEVFDRNFGDETRKLELPIPEPVPEPPTISKLDVEVNKDDILTNLSEKTLENIFENVVASEELREKPLVKSEAENIIVPEEVAEKVLETVSGDEIAEPVVDTKTIQEDEVVPELHNPEKKKIEEKVSDLNILEINPIILPKSVDDNIVENVSEIKNVQPKTPLMPDRTVEYITSTQIPATEFVDDASKLVVPFNEEAPSLVQEILQPIAFVPKELEQVVDQERRTLAILKEDLLAKVNKVPEIETIFEDEKSIPIKEVGLLTPPLSSLNNLDEKILAESIPASIEKTPDFELLLPEPETRIIQTHEGIIPLDSKVKTEVPNVDSVSNFNQENKSTRSEVNTAEIEKLPTVEISENTQIEARKEIINAAFEEEILLSVPDTKEEAAVKHILEDPSVPLITENMDNIRLNSMIITDVLEDENLDYGLEIRSDSVTTSLPLDWLKETEEAIKIESVESLVEDGPEHEATTTEISDFDDTTTSSSDSSEEDDDSKEDVAKKLAKKLAKAAKKQEKEEKKRNKVKSSEEDDEDKIGSSSNRFELITKYSENEISKEDDDKLTRKDMLNLFSEPVHEIDNQRSSSDASSFSTSSDSISEISNTDTLDHAVIKKAGATVPDLSKSTLIVSQAPEIGLDKERNLAAILSETSDLPPSAENEISRSLEPSLDFSTDVLDRLESNNEIVSSKNTRHLIRFGEEFVAKDLVLNVVDESSPNDIPQAASETLYVDTHSRALVFVGCGLFLVAGVVLMASVFLIIKKTRRYGSMDFTMQV